MFNGKSVAVVVPAKNESRQIAGVLTTMPDFVDEVIVVDDGSTDETAAIVRSLGEQSQRPIHLIRHPESRGVGAAIATGYLEARDRKIEVTAVMAGDGQMDPADLASIVSPVAADLADYSKGNRFSYTDGFMQIPLIRKSGNFVLSMMTKIVSGYWHVSDTQCGYAAISLFALNRIDVENIFPTYGCPNDILVKLNIAGMRVMEVPVKPLYGVGEKSQMHIPRIVIPILSLLGRQFCRRICVKYMLLSGHPLVFAYFASFLFFLALLPVSAHLILSFAATGIILKGALTLAGFLAVAAIQLLVTAFSMDADANRHLCIQLSPKWNLQSQGDAESSLPETLHLARPAA